MVSKKQLQKEIKTLSSKYDRILQSLVAINKKLVSHIKGEKDKTEEDKNIENWLRDDRIDEIQDFLHKGVK